jgi:hypothetical protein
VNICEETVTGAGLNWQIPIIKIDIEIETNEV